MIDKTKIRLEKVFNHNNNSRNLKTIQKFMKINLNSYFTKKNLKPLIVAEISANHNGNKKVF